MWELIGQFAQGKISPALNYQPGNPAFARVWDEIVTTTEEFNDPGTFTTFAAFEWAALRTGDNLHHNVMLADGPGKTLQFLPYTTMPPLGSINPRDLWA